MFRIIIKEKLLHVMSKMQFLLTSQWKNGNPLPIPDVIQLTNMSSEVVLSLNLADKLTSKYETARIMLALRLKMGEAGVIQLIGIAYRSWDAPTLSLDLAMSAGMHYKGFQIDFAQASSPGTMPGRFSALSETVQISITYLQRQMEEENSPGSRHWSNWIISLPPKYDCVLKRVKLPNWLCEHCFEGVIREIKESRQLVNIAQSGDQEKAI